ncbi:fimbrial protein, partial [Klebsiella pneumoniae]|nr:fimbrial protein [Klebsiella pneumoniae]
MLHLLYRPGKAKRLASGKSKRFAVSHSQGNILMKKIVILITLLMLGGKAATNCTY